MRLGSSTTSLAALISSFAFTACGSSDSSSESTQQSASPTVAVNEVGKTRAALKAALQTYKDGDAASAQEQVAEAYVSHFEEVEEPLEAKDAELKEALEHAISDDLRADMKAGKSPATVAARVNKIVADLDKAEAALR
jgi:high-affinity iron transporter